MSITTVGLQLEVLTQSVRKVTQDIHTQDLLSKDEKEIRYAEWKWIDTHLAVIEMLIQHLRRRIAKKVDIEYQATGLVREGKIKDSRKQREASARKTEQSQPSCKVTKRPVTSTRRYKRNGIDVSINLDIQRNTGNNP